MSNITRLIRQLERASRQSSTAAFCVGRGHFLAAHIYADIALRALKSVYSVLGELPPFDSDLVKANED